jgi:hypothetical protein
VKQCQQIYAASKLTNFNISHHAVFILDIASETVLFNREENQNTD